MFIGKTKMEYLGFWVKHNGVITLDKKIEAIENMIPPNTQKGVNKFIGLVKNHQNMWEWQSHDL